jgi:hypothetical protein
MKSVKWLKVLLAVSSPLLFSVASIEAQEIASVAHRFVEREDMAEYIKREQDYWKPIAEKAIEEGRMSVWSVWQRIGGFNMNEEPNILIYAEFDKTSDLELYGSGAPAWGKVFPDKKFSDISVRNLFEAKAYLYQKPLVNMVSAGSVEMPEIIRINFVKANETLADYLKMEQEVWAPFIAEQIKKGNTNVTSWYLGEVLNPGGTDRPYDAVSVDGFGSLSAALSPDFDEGITMPDLSEFGKVHKKVRRQLYRLVAHAR